MLLKKQDPPPPTHTLLLRHHRHIGSSRRMKQAHSVLHCSSLHNPHGQIFSFPPGRLPIQRISPLLTTLHCPDERTYPPLCIMAAPTNDMATNWTNTCISIRINVTKKCDSEIASFVNLHQRLKRGFHGGTGHDLGSGSHPTLPLAVVIFLIKHASAVHTAVQLFCCLVAAQIVTPLELVHFFFFIGCKKKDIHMAERC